MAPKKAEVIDNPLVGSSSEEEESGSSGEESESSAEVSKKDESSKKPESDSDSESDSESEPAKTSKQPVVAKAKPKTDSAVTVPERSTSKRPLEETESEVNKKLKKSSAEVSKKDKSSKKPESDSEGESDSESEPAQTIKQPVVAKAKPKTSGSAVTVPESSTAKRPLKKAESEANKKLKTSETENVEKPITNDEVKKISGDDAKKISGDDAKKMFQRLFSETDEIALLQGMLDFTSTKGDPYEDSDAFCIYVKKLIHFDATKNQIVTKLQRLKKKFVNTVKKSLKKGKSEDDIVFAKDIDQKAFELARKIWGTNGVLASKSRKKLGGTPAPKDMKLATPKKPEEAKTPEKREAKVVNTSLSIGREIAVFFNAENSSSCGLDESTITAVWKKVVDGADKTEVEEKWKKIKAKQVELCLQRTQLVNETAKLIFKAYES